MHRTVHYLPLEARFDGRANADRAEREVLQMDVEDGGRLGAEISKHVKGGSAQCESIDMAKIGCVFVFMSNGDAAARDKTRDIKNRSEDA